MISWKPIQFVIIYFECFCFVSNIQCFHRCWHLMREESAGTPITSPSIELSGTFWSIQAHCSVWVSFDDVQCPSLWRSSPVSQCSHHSLWGWCHWKQTRNQSFSEHKNQNYYCQSSILVSSDQYTLFQNNSGLSKCLYINCISDVNLLTELFLCGV